MLSQGLDRCSIFQLERAPVLPHQNHAVSVGVFASGTYTGMQPRLSGMHESFAASAASRRTPAQQKTPVSIHGYVVREQMP